MVERVRQGTATFAVALVLAYGMAATLPPVRDFAPWPFDLFWLSVTSVICGVLLGLTSSEAGWSMIAAASILAILIFTAIRSYIVWQLVGQQISLSLFDLVLSDLVFLYVIQRGLILFMASAIFGLIGAVFASIILPEHYNM